MEDDENRRLEGRNPYEDYEAQCEEQRARNREFLEEFRAALEEEGVAKNKADKHIINMDLYLNFYLLYEDVCTMEDGVCGAGRFLGYWAIRRCFASPTMLQSTAASLRKFYGFQVEKGRVTQEDYDAMRRTIRTGMQTYLATSRRYRSDENFLLH